MNGPFKISVVHATARIGPFPSFPRGWLDSAEAFLHRAYDAMSVEYILVVHSSRIREYEREYTGKVAALIAGFGNFRVVENKGRDCCVDQANAGAAFAEGEIILGGMDDLFPPHHWDLAVWGELQRRTNGVFGFEVLHVSTGSPSDNAIFVPQICTRGLRELRGYFLHPSYESMFADNEFTEHARRENLVIEAPHIRFEHRHPIFRTAEMDDVYAMQNRGTAYADGLANLEHRRALGFPVISEPVKAPKKLGVVMCLPGETFNQEYVRTVLDLSHHMSNALNIRVDAQLAHTSNVYVTRMIITEAVLGFDPQPDLWLWLDDDNLLSPAQLEMLLADLAERPELDAVVGWCWCDSGRKNDNWQMSCGHQDQQLRMVPFTKEDMERGPVVGIEWSGFPCVLIRGEAMRQLGPQAFVPIVRPDVMFGFTSEDTSFWWNFKQAGFRVAVDLRVEVPHMKTRIIRPVLAPNVMEAVRDLEGAAV